MSSRIASRYSKSLLRYSQTTNSDEQVVEDMRNLAQLSRESSELVALLSNPVIVPDDKWEVLDKLFATFHETSRSFIRVCTYRRRSQYLPAMANDYIRLHDDYKGIARAKVYSAIPLSESAIEQLKRYLSGALQKSDVVLEHITDPSVIGGLVVRYQDRLLDMSVSRELRQFRKELILN